MKRQIQHEKTVPPAPPLKEGQVWTLKDKCLEVKRVGKHLVEFLITQEGTTPPQKHLRLRKQLESIVVVQRFLLANKAVMVAGPN